MLIGYRILSDFRPETPVSGQKVFDSLTGRNL